MKYEGLQTIVAFDEMEVPMPIGKVLELANLKQLRIAKLKNMLT